MSKDKEAATIPQVVVVSAPSGTGKTTLNRRLIAEHPKVQMSVSFTARKPRPGEIDGVDYHFVTNDQFLGLIAKGEMLEYAEVFGTLYGTAKKEVHRLQTAGLTALLEIDVQGWQQAKTKLVGARSIFILPPSVEALWHRLESRATEAKEVRWRRLMSAKSEIAAGHLYDAFIINHDLKTAYAELQDIVIYGKNAKIGPEMGAQICQRLLAEFEKAPWLKKLSQDLTDK